MSLASFDIEILDTTLRDGEQTPGVNFLPEQRIEISKKLLSDVSVNRIEIGCALSSDSDKRAYKDVSEWANDNGFENAIEILTFVDYKRSLNWLDGVPCKTIGLLCKASLAHCSGQLNKTPEQHFDDISATLDYAFKNNKTCSIFLEDWSRGVQDSPDYVFELMDHLKNYPIQRFYLCDTLGVLGPETTSRYCSLMLQKYPDSNFELHTHNDYGLALSNCLEALKVGIRGFHATVNGLGERAGNLALEQFVTVLNDFTNFKASVNETHLYEISKVISEYSRKFVSTNRPIVGQDVFTHTSGIHVDGQIKGNLYSSLLDPKRFNRDYQCDLGKLSGNSTIEFHLKNLGLSIEKEDVQKLKDSLKSDIYQEDESIAEKIKRLLQK